MVVVAVVAIGSLQYITSVRSLIFRLLVYKCDKSDIYVDL